VSVAEKTKFWKNVGRVLNTGVGTKVAEATGGIVNRMVTVGTAPKLGVEGPFATMQKSLDEATVALVSTGGFYLDGDEPFDIDKATGGPSFREIPSDTARGQIRVAHTHDSPRYVDKDLNTLFPLEHLRALAREGVFKLAPRAFSFGFGGLLTGAFIDPERGTAHQLAAKLAEDEVDLALIVPA